MEAVLSRDGGAVVVMTAAGQRTIPLARWPAEAEALGLGEMRDDGFTPVIPAAAAPAFLPLTRGQLRLALLQAGVTAADVEGAINGLPAGEVRETALILWQDSASYHRDHALIESLAAALKLEGGVVDGLWRVAEGL